jgi:hypothetical protein
MAGVVDGRRWLRQRIQHLEAELQGEVSEARRAQLTSELEQAQAELARQRRRRWLMWGTGP